MSGITGGCLCGAVRITAASEPKRVGICHCRDCQKHHGAIFYAAAVVDAASFSVTGETASYEGRAFCPICGSSVYAVSGDDVEVHLGALDDPDRFTPSYELWTCRRASWLPGFDGMASHLKGRGSDEPEP